MWLKWWCEVFRDRHHKSRTWTCVTIQDMDRVYHPWHQSKTLVRQRRYIFTEPQTHGWCNGGSFLVSAAGSVRELCGAYSTLTCKVVDPYEYGPKPCFRYTTDYIMTTKKRPSCLLPLQEHKGLFLQTWCIGLQLLWSGTLQTQKSVSKLYNTD